MLEIYEKFAEKLQSSRLAELFFPLIYTCPSNTVRNQIYEFAQKLDVERWEELTASPEPIILAAIVQARNQGKVQSGSRIKVSDIAEIVNSNLPEREQWSHRFVSKIAKTLGFSKTYVDGRVAYRYDERMVERLKTDPRYAHAFDTPSGKPSLKPKNHLKAVDWDEVFNKEGK